MPEGRWLTSTSSRMLEDSFGGIRLPKREIDVARECVDRILPMPTEEAWDTADRVAHEEGLFIGHSGGASVAVVPHSSPAMGNTCSHFVVFTKISSLWGITPAWTSSQRICWTEELRPRWPLLSGLSLCGRAFVRPFEDAK